MRNDGGYRSTRPGIVRRGGLLPIAFSGLFFVIAWMGAASTAQAALVKLEAESSLVGTDFITGIDGETEYITTTTDGGGNSPGTLARMKRYNVTFPASGVYSFFARIRVGPGGSSDDSFFYSNGFGFNRLPTDNADWILCNNLNTPGFTAADDVVTGEGSAGNQVWKWINLSEYYGSESPIAFSVPADQLNQSFWIGAREDGLWIDALAFGSIDYAFTVANLDAGTDGTPKPNGSGSCTVQWEDVRQVIDGFGASSAWRSTWSTALADMFFSTNNGTGTDANGTPYPYTGIGLSLLRTRIAPGGGTVEQSIMQMAQARGARVWSAPWSPAPVNLFKSNGNLNGGSFIGSDPNYQAYASQLAGYVERMLSQYGVNLYAISIQNEPDASVTTYESCNWTAQQIHDFLPYLHSALVASNVSSTKIMLPESQNWTDPQGLRLTTMNDPSTASLVGIIANHNYVGNNAAGDQTTPAAINSYGKALWETEVAKLSGNDSSIFDGLYWAGRVHLFLTAAQANAWHYWWLIAANNEGLCTDNGPAKRMYTLGNFSRFVRPGFYRINVANSVGPVQISAYRHLTNGGFAIVAINQTASNVVQTFNLAGFPAVGSVTPWTTSTTDSLTPQSSVLVSNASFVHLLPLKSVVTFVGQAGVVPTNTPPTLMSVADQSAHAGRLLVVTNVAMDADVPVQQITYSLLSVDPTNAALGTSDGVFTWRPLVSQADTTNIVMIKATDNGAPVLSATNSFKITVNPLTPVVMETISESGGQVTLMVNGPMGPDYTLWTSTNLADWQSLMFTNPVTLPFGVITRNSGEQSRYFRFGIGP